ncbi:hypothetical protein BKA65DRAFT_600110 [Rhexocercosporidium sp. MPI-PUGE-AT-0058]|nr:hypothetical protein BKA65DRAFT_600110 [Rhexocercosporidium sp. MPI-PUGE-AT-0058]
MKNHDLVPPLRESLAEGAARNRDPDISAYFLVRRTSTESDAVSPKFGTSRIPSHRKLVTPKSQKSGGSSQGLRTKASSVSSSPSMNSKDQAIRDWNDRSIGLVTPSTGACESSHSVDPPRAPREGCEWVWFPEGYWAEREIPLPKKSGSSQKWWNRSPKRKSKSKSKSKSLAKTEIPEKSKPPADLPRIKIGSLVSRKSSSSAMPNTEHSALMSRKSSNAQTQSIKNQPSIQPDKNTLAYCAIHPEEQLGLYCRTKKTIRSRINHKAASTEEPSVSEVNRLNSRTTMLLQGTSQYLGQVQRERCQISVPCRPPDPPQTPCSQSSRSTRRFGLAPWHRRSSHESILSASSSVFRLLLGKPPVTTPNPDYQYEGNDGRTYPKVDITSPDPVEPTFLPSEAKRINTPPMFPGTPDVQARGFFFDLNPAKGGSMSTSSTISNIATKNRSNGDSPSIEWWEVDTQHANMGNKTARPLNGDITTHSNKTPFELNLPEHLPNSPLCPKNSMHQSGGTGICPFHGRKRSNHLMTIKGVDSQESSAIPSGTTSTRNFLG